MYPEIALIFACTFSSFVPKDLKQLAHIFFYFYSGLVVLRLFGALVAG